MDPVRDGKFAGNGLMGTGQNQKSGLLEAPGPGILDLTLYENKKSQGIFTEGNNKNVRRFGVRCGAPGIILGGVRSEPRRHN